MNIIKYNQGSYNMSKDTKKQTTKELLKQASEFQESMITKLDSAKPTTSTKDINFYSQTWWWSRMLMRILIRHNYNGKDVQDSIGKIAQFLFKYLSSKPTHTCFNTFVSSSY